MWRRSLLLAWFAAGCLFGCSGSETILVPDAASVGAIDVCQGRKNCNFGKFSITDTASIYNVVQVTSNYAKGWQTERQMALSTGWLTYPTPESSAVFQVTSGSYLVLWFGPGWMGAAVDSKDTGRVRYFRKISEEDSTQIRSALRITRP